MSSSHSSLSTTEPGPRASIHNCPLTKPIFDARELLRLCGSQAFCPGSQVSKAPLAETATYLPSGTSNVTKYTDRFLHHRFPVLPRLSSGRWFHISSHLRRPCPSARMVLGLPGSFSLSGMRDHECPHRCMQKYRRLSGNPPFKTCKTYGRKEVLLVIQTRFMGCQV